jgi:hypothetical protein
MKIKFTHLGGLILGLFVNTAAFGQLVTTYAYTGSLQTYTVPPGITSVQIETWGAQGQATTIESYAPSTGGLGGYAKGNLAVTPGQVLNIYVGGRGVAGATSFNGGGIGGFGTPSDGMGGHAGSGGGASDVRVGGVALANRVIVAGGGGGGGRDYVNGSCVPCGTGGNGGAGGALIGSDGVDPGLYFGSYGNPGSRGKGGTGAAGGAGGVGTEGAAGNPGVLGIGGNGQPGNQSVASGAGGGGYYGGGSGGGVSPGSGAAGAGGAGGSSYLGGVTLGTTTAGLRSGNGQVVITELCNALTLVASDLELCENTELTLTATSFGGGVITWSDGIENGVAFPVDEDGTFSYTATSSLVSDCPYTVEITVFPAPTVVANASETAICVGDEITMTGDGADTYTWNYGAEDGVAYDPALAAGTYAFEVTGTESVNGCTNVATIEIEVNELTTLSASSDQDVYCDGEETILTGEGALTYVWDLGVTDGEPFTQAIGVTTYTVEGTSEDGCVATFEIDVTVVENPEITIATTDEFFGDDGTATITIVSGESPYTFDWSNDGTGDDDDDQNLTDLTAGTYVVVMTDANGCTAQGEITINSFVSVEGFDFKNFKVYPNPTSTDFTIVQDGEFNYSLTTITGELISTGVGVNSEIVSMSNLAKGTYILTVNVDNQAQLVKIVKN